MIARSIGKSSRRGLAKAWSPCPQFPFAASVLDFLDAERSFRATQLAYRQELASYLTNLAQLEAAVGAPLTP
ncbi:MAG TPA: hypothetical protein VK473_04560 [Terriglobales bacterium]|nr:hypothetical protein [Terriglobales bacterium]